MSLNTTTADVMLHLLDGSVCQDLHRKLLFPSSAMDTMGCYLETTYVDYPTSNFCSVRALCSTGMCLSHFSLYCVPKGNFLLPCCYLYLSGPEIPSEDKSTIWSKEDTQSSGQFNAQGSCSDNRSVRESQFLSEDCIPKDKTGCFRRKTPIDHKCVRIQNTCAQSFEMCKKLIKGQLNTEL